MHSPNDDDMIQSLRNVSVILTVQNRIISSPINKDLQHYLIRQNGLFKLVYFTKQPLLISKLSDILSLTDKKEMLNKSASTKISLMPSAQLLRSFQTFMRKYYFCFHFCSNLLMKIAVQSVYQQCVSMPPKGKPSSENDLFAFGGFCSHSQVL